MGRKVKNTVDYFSHPVDEGKRMNHIRGKFGNDGYSVWYMILEELGKADNHFLTFGDYLEFSYLANKFDVTEDVLTDIVNELVKVKTFDKQLWNEFKVIYCPQFMSNMEFVYGRRKRDVITRDELYSIYVDINDVSVSRNEVNVYINDVYVNISTQRKGKETKGKETKLNKPKAKEVIVEVDENGNPIKWYDWFCKSWVANSKDYRKKPSYLRTLTRSAQDNLRAILRDFAEDDVRKSIVGLMFQKSFPNEQDFANDPTHLLKEEGKFISKYLEAFESNNREIYGKIKKFE